LTFESKTSQLSFPLPLNPDSAIAFDVKSEERTFRSEANGLLPLSER